MPVHVAVAALGFVWSLGTTVAMVVLMLGTVETIGEDGGLLYLAMGPLTAMSFASVGTMLGVRLPSNRIGWLMLATGATFGTTFLAGASLTWLEAQDGSASMGALLDWLGPIGWYAMAALLWPRLLLLFPDGRLPSRRWRIVDLAQLATIGLLAIGALAPATEPRFPDPIGMPALAGVAAVAQEVALVLALAFMAAGLVALAVRFNRGGLVERAQLKWMLSTALLLVCGFGVSTLLTPIAPGLADTVNTVAILGLTLVPVAIGVAVLRYRLYEIDRIISRTIGWALVTGILGIVFVGAVIALQALLASFTQGETLAVAASTLIAYVLFQPMRQRIQGAVNHRFDRARDDNERLLAGFSDRLRDEVDLATIRADLVTTIDAAVRPSSVSGWLRERPEGKTEGVEP